MENKKAVVGARSARGKMDAWNTNQYTAGYTQKQKAHKTT